MNQKTILGIFAHPDDESMGPGGTLSKYASLGHRVACVTATDGGAGRLFEERPADNGELKAIRRRETTAAAEVLGIESLGFLGWEDGRLAEMDILAITETFATIIRRVKPDVVMTFHGAGISRHPDHRIVTMALTDAFIGSGLVGYFGEGKVEMLPPHTPSKLYHMTVDDARLREVDWPREVYASTHDEITTIIDTTAFADTKWAAIEAHASQQAGPPFRELYDAGIFNQEFFVRVLPSFEDGDGREDDLLAGLA